MNLLLITVLLSIMQAAPPIPRQTPNNGNATGQSITKNAQQDKTPSLQSAPVPKIAAPAPDQNAGQSKQPDNAAQTVRVTKFPSVSVSRDWIDCLTVFFTGILVIVGIVGVRAALRTLGAIEKQTAAMMNSERAWLIPELVPVCSRSGDRWYKPVPDGFAGRPSLTADEILKGEHLRHKLRVTNMGRTPAIITGYKVNCFKNKEKELISELVTFGQPFHSLGADRALEFSDDVIDVHHYVLGYEGAVYFDVTITYQHVFSKTELADDCVAYLYREQPPNLERVAIAPQQKKTAN